MNVTTAKSGNQCGLLGKIAQSWPIDHWKQYSVVVAVSGGADSVALLRALHQLHHSENHKSTSPGRLIVAHVDHGLRGKASSNDASFVRELASQLSLECVIERLVLENCVSNKGLGLESRLREGRYQLLKEVANRHGARCIVTGHTRDDQVETVLFRIMRGTGIKGLKGIQPIRLIDDHLCVARPMLSSTRQQVEEFLLDCDQDYCQDETNDSDQFTRNRMRNEVLPLLNDVFGNDVGTSVWRLADQANELSEYLNRQAEPIVENHFLFTDGTIEVDCESICNCDPVIVTLALRLAWQQAKFPLRDMSSLKWNELVDLVLAKPTTDVKRNFPGDLTVQRQKKKLFIS